MDVEALRLSELETQTEELEKQIGKLSVQQEQTTALLHKTIAAFEALHKEQRAVLEKQESLIAEAAKLQEQANMLSGRIEALETNTTALNAQAAELQENVNVLSRDMDNVYEDMNVLSAETRNRGIKLKEEVQRFLWDMTESRYEEDDESETMW
ncbi:MAG: hypothetical protein MJ065_05215 [Oscillospiraceae bacterium]|nr:hypothetical protein [Oscillospiraceae bacterium]